MRKYAVIVAGGKGIRMGNAIPKQFLPLKGKPVLTWCIEAFLKAYDDIEIILVLPEAQLSYAQIVLQPLPERIDVTLVRGGDTRFQSVKNGLQSIAEEGIVFVHDGARPLVSTSLIRALYKQAVALGSAIPAIPAFESLRVIAADTSKAIDREPVRIVQTPQVFRSSILVTAFQQDFKDTFTDEATVVEATGARVYLAPGEKSNIKITEPEDMVIAEALINAKTMA